MPEESYQFTGAEERPWVVQDESARALAAHYAPIIHFDRREPFLPSAAGYTIFHTGGPSPSFPRAIELAPSGRAPACLAIEYAIWWDWDIQHLYELEHVWVYVDENGRVVWAEASWHGGLHPMLDGRGSIPLDGDRLLLWSEPGKHAFAPSEEWLLRRQEATIRSCWPKVGLGGVWITPLFEGVIGCKTPQADRLVHTYLERRAFVPSYEFTRRFEIGPELLVPWPALRAYIPARVAHWVAGLERTIPADERRSLRIAHRGASAQAPENTLAAFELARRQGADMVELDVHLSADGVPVVIHDAVLGRTTNGTGLVRERSLAELKTLDAGHGQQIPTLAEALEWGRAADVGLYVELKAAGTVAPVVELVATREMHHLVILASFSPDLVAEVKEVAPRLRTSILFGRTTIDPVALARGCRADYVHPCWERRAPNPHELLTAEWVARVRAAGLGIITWHEERSEELAALLRLGVDGICTNRPDLLSGLAQRLRRGDPLPGR